MCNTHFREVEYVTRKREMISADNISVRWSGSNRRKIWEWY